MIPFKAKDLRLKGNINVNIPIVTSVEGEDPTIGD